ncbi:hypothetical protein G7054_g1801 [Neopestalotiopsis clavispora]|nr:hypothetical protein G7054_g1801 [Neopestalotiopsis clavispora]
MSEMKRLLSLLWLSFSIRGLHASPTCRRVDVKSILSGVTWSSPLTTVSYAGESGFTNATERWTTFDAPTYTAAVSPGSEDDVVQIVNLATSHNVSFLATGGRHGYTHTIGDLHDGLAIDLTQLDHIVVDSDAQTLTVGPGVRVEAIMDPVYDAGFFLQTGTADCPSVIGVTLGGGIGRFTGLYGLMIDALASVRIVTANGTLLEASKDTNSDLFWAVRGAGANFGIITSATYNLNTLPNNDGTIFTADLIFPANMTADYFKAVETFNGAMPAEMAGISIMTWNADENQTVLMCNWIYVGSEDDARATLAPILDLNPPYLTTQVVAANKLIQSTFSGLGAILCQDGVSRDMHSTILNNFDASVWQSTFEETAEFFNNYPNGRNSAVQYELYPNQAMSAVPLDDTPWPWRNAQGYFQTSMTYDVTDTATAEAAQALAKGLMDEVVASSGYSAVTSFVNYASGEEKQENIYGADNLPRLAALKAQWDPTQAFSFNNGLPTKYQ